MFQLARPMLASPSAGSRTASRPAKVQPPNPVWSRLATAPTATANLQRTPTSTRPSRSEAHGNFLAAEEAREHFEAGAPYFLHNHLPSTGRGLFDAMYYPPNFQITVKLKITFKDSDLRKEWEDKGFTSADVTWTEGEAEAWRKRFLKEVGAKWTGANFVLYCVRPFWESLRAKVKIKLVDVAHFRDTKGQSAVAGKDDPFAEDRENNPAQLPLEAGDVKPHFDVLVVKVPRGESNQDLVISPGRRNQIGITNLDSESLTKSRHDSGHYQRGAVHETGHMLGLDDTYVGTGDVGHEKLVKQELGHGVPVADDARVMSTGELMDKADAVTFLEAIRKATRIPEWSLDAPPIRPIPAPPPEYNDGIVPSETVA